MSAKGQERTSAPLFDHLVGLREKRWRDSYAEGLGRLEVDHQLKLGRCLHRKFGRLFTLKNAVDVAGGKSVQFNTIRPIGDQAACGGIEPFVKDCRQLVP